MFHLKISFPRKLITLSCCTSPSGLVPAERMLFIPDMNEVFQGYRGKVHLVGRDPLCGWVCCPPTNKRNQVRCVTEPEVESAALKLHLKSHELESFVAEINDILNASVTPACPCILSPFFSGMCYFSYAASKRNKNFQELVIKTNEELKLSGRKLKWVIVGEFVTKFAWTVDVDDPEFLHLYEVTGSGDDGNKCESDRIIPGQRIMYTHIPGPNKMAFQAKREWT